MYAIVKLLYGTSARVSIISHFCMMCRGRGSVSTAFCAAAMKLWPYIYNTIFTEGTFGEGTKMRTAIGRVITVRILRILRCTNRVLFFVILLG